MYYILIGQRGFDISYFAMRSAGFMWPLVQRSEVKMKQWSWINLSSPNLQIRNLQLHSANTTQISHTPIHCWTEECFQDIQFVGSGHQLHTIIVETAS